MGLRSLGHRTEAALIGPRIVTTLKLGFLVWAAIELLQGDWGDAAALVAMFLVLLVPRLLRLPWVFDGAFVAAWTLQALGQVAGFWGAISWWDTLVHAALPAVLAPTALILLTRLRALPDPFAGDEGPGTWLAIVLMVFMVAASFGALYEIYEWFMDSTFGTQYQPSNSDTMTDITANVVGGIVGGIWLAGWSAWRRKGGGAGTSRATRWRARDPAGRAVTRTAAPSADAARRRGPVPAARPAPRSDGSPRMPPA